MSPVTYPTPLIRRLFAFADDVVGGTSYENLTAGLVPDPTANMPISGVWPATGGTLDRGLTRVTRETEVRGRRAVSPPLPFRAAPVMTVPFPAYRSIVEKLMRKCLGGTDVVTGSASTGYTHTFSELGFGSTQLPTMICQMIRDDLNHKMSGGFVNRVTLDFPIDAEGTIEAEIHGLYYQNYSAAAYPTSPVLLPNPVFTDVDYVMLLRDATMYIDAQAVAIPDLMGVNLVFNNNISDPKWYANHNVTFPYGILNSATTPVLGASPLMRKLWFPSQFKLNGQMDISGTLNFGNVNTAQDLALDFAQIEKFVFTILGGPCIGTTGYAAGTGPYEQITITINAAQLTPDSQGPVALAARGDMLYAVNFGGFYSAQDGTDSTFTSLNQYASALL